MNRIRVFVVAAFLTFTASAAAEERVYFGNLHSHTSYSDGSGSPHQAYRHAREVAKLDFLAVTEHNHSLAENGAKDRRDGVLIAKDPSLYNGPDQVSLVKTAEHHTRDGFVALYGQEYSSISSGNHVGVLDAPELINAKNGRFDELLKWVEQHPDTTGKPCVLQFNHPKLGKNPKIDYGRDDFRAAGDSQAVADRKWLEKMGGATHLIEILNGPAMARDGGHRAAEVMESQFRNYLRLGFRLAPVADQDNHYFTWGTATDARTGVVVEGDLTKPKLLEALRSRHAYATEDSNLRIVAKLNGKLCGDMLPAPAANTAVEITVSIADDNEPGNGYLVEVFRGNIGGELSQVIETFTFQSEVEDEAETAWTLDDIRYTGGRQFFFLRITQADEDGDDDRAWTAPWWLEPAISTAAVEPQPSVPISLVASKRSSVFHTSEKCEFAGRISEANRITGEEARQGRRQCRKCLELGAPGVGE